MMTTRKQRMEMMVGALAITLALGITSPGRADDPPLSPQTTVVQDELGSAITLGQELEALRRIPFDQLTPAQQQRLQELQQIQTELYREFQMFLQSPEVTAQLTQFRLADPLLEPNNLPVLRRNLEQMEPSTVVYYPLILEDRLELIIATADTPPLRRTVAVTRAELNTTIAAFRQALQDSRSDPLPLAQQLYQWLIQPLEADLAQSGAETILFAPDGALRYVPLTALHDGDRWMAERFVTNHILSGLSGFTSTPTPQWRILAAAWESGGAVQLEDETLNLSPIPGTVAEVEAIAALFPNTTVIQGAEFTPEAILLLASHHNVLHLATHTALLPGEPTDSFIAFGNGEVRTLQDFNNWSLPGVDLVVLSGGETAMGGSPLSDGTEVLGLSYVFQQAGAKAVLASLWNVSDFGTQALMEAFYTGLSQELTVAEALQQAQVALITEMPTANRQQQERTSRIENSSSQSGADNPFPGYSHPYYWAAFILMGNGL